MTSYMNQYQNTLINSSSPEQILIMLYEGAIRFIGQADEALSAGDKSTKAQKICKAVAIISELSNTLDHEEGGTIAEDLDAIYNFVIRELIKANIQDDQESLRRIKPLLCELKDAWTKAIEINSMKKKEESEAEEQASAEPPENNSPGSGAL